MKICPTCQQKYADQSINFCLADGSVLQPFNAGLTGAPTVEFSRSAPTQIGSNRQTAPNQIQHQSTKETGAGRAWLWVLVIVGGVLIVLIGGFTLLMLGVVANIDDLNETAANHNRTENLTIVNKQNRSEKNSGSTEKLKSESFKLSKTDDFSTWYIGSEPNGKSTFSNGEFTVAPRGENYYWVLLTGNPEFKTAGKITKVSVKNIKGSPTDSGFGLVFHSRPDEALDSDYAFLIDSVRKVFRIVRHENSQEIVVEDWTDAESIKSGSEPNELEIRDSDGKTDFFINGEPVKTLETENLLNGVAGVYTSDGVAIAFSNMRLGN